MIIIKRQDLHRKSPRCHDNCQNYKPEGCITDCIMRFRGIYICPDCKVNGCFYGANNPIYCPGCKKVLPDYWRLERAFEAEERVKYHLGA